MQDVSDLVPSLLGGDSMSATNTVSTVPPFGAPGSESESSHGTAAGTPGPVIPGSSSGPTVVHPSGSPATSPWNRADGSPWEASSGSGEGWSR